MGWLVWVGSGMTIVGLGILIWVIVSVARARSAGLDETAMKAKLQRLVAWNMGAMGLSALGLMTVIIGFTLS